MLQKFSALLDEIVKNYPEDLCKFLEQRLQIPENKAKELAEGFNYTSDNNGQWLKINELKKMVKEYSEPFEF